MSIEQRSEPDRPSVELAGVPVDLADAGDAVRIVSSRMRSGEPLAVVSINLDHVHHFGSGGRWNGSLDRPDSETSPEWLNLIDGAPVAAQAARITGRSWPRLAGSDLIGPLLDEAEANGASVGFVGGSEATHDLLRERLGAERPALRISGYWAPSREELGDPIASRAVADQIRAARTDVLVVGLGKPRQEIWIAEYGSRSGASVFLAFGAVLDFLAGRVARAPRWVAKSGFEWAWRLLLEPRRLARRYLLDGPGAYRALRRHSAEVPANRATAADSAPKATLTIDAAATGDAVSNATSEPRRRSNKAPRFSPVQEFADVTAVVVTYNNETDIVPLVSALRGEAVHTRIRLVVVDNGSTDGTLDELSRFSDVIVLSGGGNVGYAGGINASKARWGDSAAVLILNPDLTLRPGAVRSMIERLDSTGAGIVVPRIETTDGECYPSLRREPRVSAAFGDALFGSHLSRRPSAWSELEYDEESYRYAHRIEWATGAALLVERRLADALGDWDERFFLYSEETDYFRRARDAGAAIWFEPSAVFRHRQGGSGSSRELTALMAVNRIRYAEKYTRAGRIRVAVVLHEALRSANPAHRHALRTVLRRSSWASLPKAVPAPATVSSKKPPTDPASGGTRGAIIIPAHDEAAVIERTLRSLAPYAESGGIEIIVACNGCTDDTAERARAFSGVRVIETSIASKTAALNAADRATDAWPRLYLDADIEIAPSAVEDVFRALAAGPEVAARPAYRYDTDGASALVRSYYRTRVRMPSTKSALWGAGAYALSETGHERLGAFPTLTADDLWVDRLFGDAEKRILGTEPVLVRTPRDAAGLMAILQRTSRGNSESGLASTGGSSVKELVRTLRGPVSVFDAAVYATFVVRGRLAARRVRNAVWERDESSRKVREAEVTP